MTRKLTFAIAFAIAAIMGSQVGADEQVRNQSPFRTAEYSPGEAQTTQVANGRRYRRGRSYSYRPYDYRYRRYDYSPYRYRYDYSPYGYRYYPRYYGTRRYGYYDYGRRGGGVRIGPFGVWW